MAPCVASGAGAPCAAGELCAPGAPSATRASCAAGVLSGAIAGAPFAANGWTNRFTLGPAPPDDKTVEFWVRVAQAEGHRDLRRSPEYCLRVPERREAWNACEYRDVWLKIDSAY